MTHMETQLEAAFRSLLAEAVEVRGGIESGGLAVHGEVFFRGHIIEVRYRGEPFLVIDRATLEARAAQLRAAHRLH